MLLCTAAQSNLAGDLYRPILPRWQPPLNNARSAVDVAQPNKKADLGFCA